MIPLKKFYSTGTDQEKTNSGLPEIELFHPSRTFQDGRSSCTTRIDEERRLYMQNRFKICIRSSSYTRRFQRFPKLRKRRSRIPLQVSSVRSKCSSKNFLQNNAVCHRTTKEGRDSDNILSGRHLYLSQEKRRNELLDQKSETTLRKPGVYYKLQEEYPNTIKDSGIPGFLFNSRTMIISVSLLKITSLLKRIRQVMTAPIKTCRWFAGLLGKMTSMIPAVGEALLHIRYL